MTKGIFPGNQRWFNIQKSTTIIHCINRLKGKNHIFISINAEKILDKIQHQFMIKSSQQTSNRGELFSLIYNIYIKPKTIVLLNGEKLEAFPLRSEKRQIYSLITPFQHHT